MTEEEKAELQAQVMAGEVISVFVDRRTASPEALNGNVGEKAWGAMFVCVAVLRHEDGSATFFWKKLPP